MSSMVRIQASVRICLALIWHRYLCPHLCCVSVGDAGACLIPALTVSLQITPMLRSERCQPLPISQPINLKSALFVIKALDVCLKNYTAHGICFPVPASFTKALTPRSSLHPSVLSISVRFFFSFPIYLWHFLVFLSSFQSGILNPSFTLETCCLNSIFE